MLRTCLLLCILASFTLDGLVAFKAARSPVGLRQKLQLHMLQEKQEESVGKKLSKMFKSIAPKALPAILLAAAFMASPDDALAANSGGRSGGSSFSRSSYSSGSSRTRMNSYRSSYASPTYVPVPSYSPFGFGGFGLGFGYNPFFSPFALFNPNVIVLGLVAYAAYQVLKNRVGGENFDNSMDGGSLGSGATVVSVQLALDSDWATDSNIMNTLTMLASRRDGRLTERAELARLLSDASIALLRRENDWSAAAVKGERFNQGSAQKAEPFFQKIAIQERTKFESESSGSELARRNGNIVVNPSGSTKTQAVVSLVVAIRGRSDALRSVTSANDIKACLQTLASEALTDDGENIMAVEVLWTPSAEGEVLNKRDIIVDYPELMKL